MSERTVGVGPLRPFSAGVLTERPQPLRWGWVLVGYVLRWVWVLRVWIWRCRFWAGSELGGWGVECVPLVEAVDFDAVGG